MQTELMTRIKLNKQLIKRQITATIPKANKLLDAGADVNAESPLGLTALMQAVKCGSTEVVKFLLERKADPNIWDKRVVQHLCTPVMIQVPK